MTIDPKNFSSKFAARQMRRILIEPLAKKFTYSVGQWVYLRRFKKAHKVTPSYVGPFIISRIISPTTYALRYPDSRENYIPPNEKNKDFPHGTTDPLITAGIKPKELPGINVYNAKDLRPYYMAYGSPLLSVADLTSKFGQQERSTFKKLLEGYTKDDGTINTLQLNSLEMDSYGFIGNLETLFDAYG